MTALFSCNMWEINAENFPGVCRHIYTRTSTLFKITHQSCDKRPGFNLSQYDSFFFLNYLSFPYACMLVILDNQDVFQLKKNQKDQFQNLISLWELHVIMPVKDLGHRSGPTKGCFLIAPESPTSSLFGAFLPYLSLLLACPVAWAQMADRTNDTDRGYC